MEGPEFRLIECMQVGVPYGGLRVISARGTESYQDMQAAEGFAKETARMDACSDPALYKFIFTRISPIFLRSVPRLLNGSVKDS